jgi:hypothetical protein
MNNPAKNAGLFCTCSANGVEMVCQYPLFTICDVALRSKQSSLQIDYIYLNIKEFIKNAVFKSSGLKVFSHGVLVFGTLRA